MAPNDLEEYLVMLARNRVGSAALRFGDGTQISVSFVPDMPLMVGSEPEPGGWKSLSHLDDPAALRESLEYKGDLPQ